MIEFFLMVTAEEIGQDGELDISPEQQAEPHLYAPLWKRVSWPTLPRIDKWVTFQGEEGGCGYVYSVNHNFSDNSIMVEVPMGVTYFKDVREKLLVTEGWSQGADPRF